MNSSHFKNFNGEFLVCWATIGWLHGSVTSVDRWPPRWGKGRAMEEHALQSLVTYAGAENIAILRDDRQQMVWACVSVYVSESRGNGVCSPVWKWEGKLTFSITYPPIPFPTGLGSLKAAASGVCQPHYHFVLAWGNYHPPFHTHRQTAVGGSNLRSGVLIETSKKQVSCRRLGCHHLLVDRFQCEMLLYLNILVLLLLQPALSSPVPLTTASRGCPTCRSKSTQTQPSVDSNATALAVGEPCGVYTLSCAHGLRCAPPEDEPRPLRALLEGRGVCSNASSVGPTENIHTAGKVHTLCLWMNEAELFRPGELHMWIQH